MNWRPYPLLRLLLPLMGGILLGHYGSCIPLAGIITICIITAVGLWALLGQQAYKNRWQYGVVLYMALLSLGYGLTQLQTTPLVLPPGEQVYQGRITTIAPTVKKIKLFLQLSGGTDTTGQAVPRRGRLLVYLPQTPAAYELRTGDLITLRGEARSVLAPLNPKAFDYRRYLALQRVYHQAFVKEGHWQKTGHQAGLRTWAEASRQHLLQLLRRHLPTPNELATATQLSADAPMMNGAQQFAAQSTFAVGAALSLGDKTALSTDIRNAYTGTGAMHILAVSGLHIGIVQLIVTWLLRRLPIRWRYWKLVRTLLIVLAIWAFALLTGGAPSVLRAATMFSFLAVGLAFRQQANIYNTLAASAFVLLCANPLLLFSVGFQLSYLAVLGIVYFQPLIYRSWYIPNPLGNYLWKLTAVSIAAQITTLPISLYYFHQFPVYFMLSGIAAVPAAAVILGLSLALFAFHWVPLLGGLLGQGLYGVLWATNALIYLIQQLPGGLLRGIWIGMGTVVLLYAIIACAAGAIQTRRFRWVLAGLGFLVILAGASAARQWQLARQQTVAIYHLRGASAVDYFSGQQAVHLQSSPIEPTTLRYAAEQHRWFRGASELPTLPLHATHEGDQWWTRPAFAQLGATSLVIPTDAAPRCPDAPLPVIAYLLTDRAPRDLVPWLDCLPPQMVIIDGSASRWVTKEWEQVCVERGIAVHRTGVEGACVLHGGQLRK